MDALRAGHFVEATEMVVRDVLDENLVVGEPKRGARRFWTTTEERVLRANYATQGLEGCLSLLPGRTAASIYGRAGKLGLTGPQRAPYDFRRQRWTPSDAIDAVIRRLYPTCTKKLDVTRLAKTVGRPRWWVSKRAVALGLVAPRFKTPDWSAEELVIVLEKPWLGLRAIQRRLAARGYRRSETAIKVRLTREGADRQDPHHFSACGLAKLMGVDSKVVTGWIAKGWLAAKRRGTDRVATQGGDSWWIHTRAIRSFIVGNAAAIDIRKVDKFWFIDLLASRAPPAGEP